MEGCDYTFHQLGSCLSLGLNLNYNTPPKTNMEPENGGPLEKEIPALETIISRFHVNFWGCSSN